MLFGMMGLIICLAVSAVLVKSSQAFPAIYNNTADTCGADVDNTDGGTLTLIPAEDMVVSGFTILGWCLDEEGNRYADTDDPVEVSEISGLTVDIALIAACGYTIPCSVDGDMTLYAQFAEHIRGDGVATKGPTAAVLAAAGCAMLALYIVAGRRKGRRIV